MWYERASDLGHAAVRNNWAAFAPTAVVSRKIRRERSLCPKAAGRRHTAMRCAICEILSRWLLGFCRFSEAGQWQKKAGGAAATEGNKRMPLGLSGTAHCAARKVSILSQVMRVRLRVVS